MPNQQILVGSIDKNELKKLFPQQQTQQQTKKRINPILGFIGGVLNFGSSSNSSLYQVYVQFQGNNASLIIKGGASEVTHEIYNITSSNPTINMGHIGKINCWQTDACNILSRNKPIGQSNNLGKLTLGSGNTGLKVGEQVLTNLLKAEAETNQVCKTALADNNFLLNSKLKMLAAGLIGYYAYMEANGVKV